MTSTYKTFLWAIFFLVALPSYAPALPHDVHSSMIKLEYFAHTKSINVVVNVFTDDMEKMLSVYHKREIKADDAKLNEWMKKYLSQKLEIKLDDGLPSKLIFRGVMQQDIISSFEFEIENVKPWKKIDISNNIATEIYSDQSNLVQLIADDKKKILEFDSKQLKQSILFATLSNE